MVAVSVAESEALKMQDPFKRYVKLSRLKIYVCPGSPGAEASPSCSLCAAVEAARRVTA